MDLQNDFEVSVGIDEAWVVLNDVERIAPCLPGAQLTEVDGDEYRGTVKVKVGPITSQYKGKATFVEQNRDDYRVVLRGEGRDTRGAGNANALITATLESLGPERTKVNVVTDLKVTGKVAQFGRGVMADISAKLMGQFANNLEKMLEDQKSSTSKVTRDDLVGAVAAAGTSVGAAAAADAAAGNGNTSAGASGASTSGPRKISMPEPDAVDLLDAAGSPVMKRFAPVAGGALLLMVLRWLLRARRR